jgi:hypothetical protein
MRMANGRDDPAQGQDLRIDATRPDSVAISAMGADARQCNHLIASTVKQPVSSLRVGRWQ